MKSIIDERKVAVSMTGNIPSAAGINYKRNDEVLVYEK